jgi:hypothetical protein
MTYHYSVIRFVPDAARGEFINLGAIVGDDEQQDWELRLISNFARARAIDVQGFLPAAMRFAGELEQLLPTELGPSDDHLSVDLLQRLSGEMNNIVQISTPTPIVAEAAAEALDVLFDHVVLDPAARRFRFEKKHRAQRVTRDAYRRHEIPDEAIKQRVRVDAGQYQGQFDFAVHNGEAVQLVNCWSFQLPNQQELADQVKAWAWVVHEMRRGDGARVAAGDTTIYAAPDLEIAAVCIPPKDGGDTHAYDEAQAAFVEVEVQQLAPEEADQLGEHAAAALATAAHTTH